MNKTKMEANQNLDLSSDTKEPMEYYIHVKVENDSEDIPVKEIKRETEFQEIDIKKDPGSPESEHSITPIWFEVPVKEEKASSEIKFTNTEDNVDIGETVITEPSAAPASISKENKSGAERRKNKSEDKQCRCEICDRLFTSTFCLKQHIRIHTGEKPYKCGDCDYRSTDNSKLKKHMRKHTGEKPYKCEACGYRCNDGSSLRKHVRMHTGEKPFKCGACDYRCTVGSSLKKHMRTHTGGKPYKCEACDYRCTNASNLKRHMRRTHTGEICINVNVKSS